MSTILGINCYHPGASAALLVNGKPVAAVAEERLNRVKYYAAFPALAILKCLDMAGLDFSDIDHVAVGRDKSANRIQKLKYVASKPSKLINFMKIFSSRSKMDDLKSTMARECGVAHDSLRFQQHNIEHHIAHIASAYFISPWEHAAGLTVDGSGDFSSSIMAECRGAEIKVQHRIYVPHSLGSLYTMICGFIGYDRYGDEGKVMGLAPLGSDSYRELFQDMIELTRDGFRLNPDYFIPFGDNQGMSIDADGQMVVHRHHSDKMIELLGEARQRHGEITKRDQNLAHGVQARFEEIYMHLLNILHEQVPTDRLVLAGGCSLNSVANGKLFDHTPFQQTCIQPAAGDDGLALGASLYVSNALLKEGNRWIMTSAYLGPEYSETQIEQALTDRGVVFQKLARPDLLKKTIDKLEKGNVVGWYQGRCEWGPRALGNRSILAHPSLPDMKATLNARIKHRENFRPFAPVVLADRQSEVFEHNHSSPFMLHVFNIREAWRSRLCAVNHVDNTGRLQTVTKQENELYYDLIHAFEQRTGIPVLLNTSFNENEPIVDTPEQAVDCYLRTRMDTLVLGNFFCHKAIAE